MGADDTRASGVTAADTARQQPAASAPTGQLADRLAPQTAAVQHSPGAPGVDAPAQASQHGLCQGRVGRLVEQPAAGQLQAVITPRRHAAQQRAGAAPARRHTGLGHSAPAEAPPHMQLADDWHGSRVQPLASALKRSASTRPSMVPSNMHDVGQVAHLSLLHLWCVPHNAARAPSCHRFPQGPSQLMGGHGAEQLPRKLDCTCDLQAECVVCLDAAVGVCLVPCGRLCLCGGCAAALCARAPALCPLCCDLITLSVALPPRAAVRGLSSSSTPGRLAVPSFRRLSSTSHKPVSLLAKLPLT